MKLILVSFGVAGALLLTNHWGAAIKVTNYLFFILLAWILYAKYSEKTA